MIWKSCRILCCFKYLMVFLYGFWIGLKNFIIFLNFCFFCWLVIVFFIVFLIFFCVLFIIFFVEFILGRLLFCFEFGLFFVGKLFVGLFVILFIIVKEIVELSLYGNIFFVKCLFFILYI